VAFGFGLAVSLLSGVYPAREAAARRPVEALREA
jgi:ABC-type lipoprotein release transport system permease subunit